VQDLQQQLASTTATGRTSRGMGKRR
jgi:hypothetical protein